MHKVTSRPLGEADGVVVTGYTIVDGAYSLSVMDLGATVTSLVVPGADGKAVDVILGYDTPQGYADAPGGYLGATIGRFANRISKGFELDGRFYPLFANERGDNCLHGGKRGFDKYLWRGEISGGSVVMRMTSPDGDEGFPAALEVAVIFSLRKGRFSIEYEYRADGRTPVSLTNHSYFNLNGHASGDILSHTVNLNAAAFLAVDEKLIPVLPPRAATGAFDFSAPSKIGGRSDDQFEYTKYFDHAFLLDGGVAAVVIGDRTGIRMTVETDMPCVQFYCGNFLEGRAGKGGAVYDDYGGLCLETGYAPNAPNNGLHPAVWAIPDVLTHSKTCYIFD